MAEPETNGSDGDGADLTEARTEPRGQSPRKTGNSRGTTIPRKPATTKLTRVRESQKYAGLLRNAARSRMA